MPDRLERQVEFLEQHPEFIGCGSRVVMMRGQKECGETFWHPMGEDNFKATLLFMAACLPSTMMFRRAELVKQKLYFFAEKCLEDYDFLVKVCARNRMVNLPQSVVRYHLSSTQISCNPQVIEQEKTCAIKLFWQLCKMPDVGPILMMYIIICMAIMIKCSRRSAQTVFINVFGSLPVCMGSC